MLLGLEIEGKIMTSSTKRRSGDEMTQECTETGGHHIKEDAGDLKISTSKSHGPLEKEDQFAKNILEVVMCKVGRLPRRRKNLEIATRKRKLPRRRRMKKSITID